MIQPHQFQIVKWLSKNNRIGNIETILYIGMNLDPGKKHEKDLIEIVFWDVFKKKNIETSVLEIYKPYIDFGPQKYPMMKFYHGDVRDVDKIFNTKFDCVVWWHGPEHIPEEDLVSTIKKLELLTKRYVVLGSPEGFLEQGPDKDNHWDNHLSGPDTKFYQSLGYESWAVMDPNFLCAVAFKEI